MRTNSNLNRCRMLLVCSTLLLTGCASYANVDPNHVLAFSRRGFPADPTGNRCRENPEEKLYCGDGVAWQKKDRLLVGTGGGWAPYDEHMDNILDAIANDPDQRRNILLFIHGGLNSRSGALARTAVLERRISAAGTSYPLFINWRSSLRSTYADHLLYLRQGKYFKGWRTTLAPIYLIADLVGGLVRTPLVWLGQAGGARRATGNTSSRRREKAALDQLAAADPTRFWVQEDDCVKGETPHTAGDIVRDISRFAPTKLVVAPLLEGVAPSAWRVMKRRTDSLMYRDCFFRKEYPLEPAYLLDRPCGFAATRENREPEGALAQFIQRLAAEIETWNLACPPPADGDDDGCRYTVTLVGHSMGAIVVNNIVKLYGDALPIDRLVYLAAAASVQEYEDAVMPMLERQIELDRWPRTEVYHVTLAEQAELRESNAADLIPRGSLLVWLDSYLDDPRTTRHRMAGRSRNLARSMALPGRDPALENQVHMKVYGAGRCHRGQQPQRHGDFSSFYKFWDPACVDPAEGAASCSIEGECTEKAGHEPCFSQHQKGWQGEKTKPTTGSP